MSLRRNDRESKSKILSKFWNSSAGLLMNSLKVALKTKTYSWRYWTGLIKRHMIVFCNAHCSRKLITRGTAPYIRCKRCYMGCWLRAIWVKNHRLWQWLPIVEGYPTWESSRNRHYIKMLKIFISQSHHLPHKWRSKTILEPRSNFSVKLNSSIRCQTIQWWIIRCRINSVQWWLCNLVLSPSNHRPNSFNRDH